MKKRSDYHEFYDFIETPFGTLYIIFSASAVTGISFQKPQGIIFHKTGQREPSKKELVEYFEHGRTEFTCKTEFAEGTGFEKKVWTTLKEVPYGETRTYKWLAERIGKPRACRAVGSALGKNPIPIIFPCHRIIESDGSLGGYSSGVEVKRRLLEMEFYTKLSMSPT